MSDRTRKLWEKQTRLVGDRTGLFGAIAEVADAKTVLYPGSYVDLTPSIIWPTVTYVDVDRRAHQFFSDAAGVGELILRHGVDPDTRAVRFIPADYTDPLDIADKSVDLLVSLYAGFVSEHCTRYLRPGGFLFVNSSHGDAAMASLDTRYRLAGVIVSRPSGYSVRQTELDTYLVPKRDINVTAELLRKTGRGIAYTKSPFAYLFERIE